MKNSQCLLLSFFYFSSQRFINRDVHRNSNKSYLLYLIYERYLESSKI
jgi:hypothetical protein